MESVLALIEAIAWWIVTLTAPCTEVVARKLEHYFV